MVWSENEFSNIEYFFEGELATSTFFDNLTDAGFGDGFTKVHLAADIEVEILTLGVRKEDLAILNDDQSDANFDLWLHMAYILHHAYMVG